MLDLQSERWAELQHAYGDASNIPALLAALREWPASDCNSETWFALWSSLAHQGDVYDASIAAVPHVVAALEANPAKAGADFFHFPAWVEICRFRQDAKVPEDLEAAYRAALVRLPVLVGIVSQREWDPAFTACVLAAVAAAKSQHNLAEATLEMESAALAADVLDWLANR